MEKSTNNQELFYYSFSEISQMKFILELLKEEPMTIECIQLLCNRKKLIPKDATENHILFLEKLGKIERKNNVFAIK